MTCHAAIVSRELGIPCIVGTTEATKKLKEGMTVTVDGKLGQVYEGRVVSEAAKSATAAGAATVVAQSASVTATRVYVNIGVPEKAEEYSKLPADGVGLMRIEFIFTSHIREHPMDLIKRGQGQMLVDKLADGIAAVARAFHPRPVVVRLSDFKTNEYREMPGGEAYEPAEANPMIGWRGCSRYISPLFKEAFMHELKAFVKVREEMGLKNAYPMLPFVRAEWELKEIVAMMEAAGLRRGPDMKLYLMAEIPSNIFLADVFSKYCDGFSIGSNDLTQCTLGLDRDSTRLHNVADERNEAVVALIKQAIKVCRRKKVKIGICGQAPSDYPTFAAMLMKAGIDSVSLNPDSVLPTRLMLARKGRK
jgi:pyruvate,water dikinase